ncbi:MAG: HGGxSTG domain-containing protein [Waddliaceae bacterium]
MQRCRAKSKRSGNQCKNYAIKGWGVCRMHGAGGGPKTAKGLKVCKKASLKHGFYTQESVEEIRFMRALAKGEKMDDRYID